MKKFFFASMACALSLTTSLVAQHGHGYAGDANGDGYLDFVNTSEGTVLTNLGTRSMVYSTATNPDTGVNYSAAGYNYNGAWTPAALSYTNTYGFLSGSNIQLVLYSVSYVGPAINPEFAIFDVDLDNPVTSDGMFEYYPSLSTPSVTMTAGTTGGTAGIMLTDPLYFADTPSDPEGHIHGRRFAVTDPGTYTIQWALVNTGSGGGDSLSNPNTQYQLFTQTWNVVPEPTTAALVVIALGAGVACFRRKKTA
jgi:hypothetical protein